MSNGYKQQLTAEEPKWRLNMKNSSTSTMTKGRNVWGQLDNKDDLQCKCPAMAAETQTLSHTVGGIARALLF